MIISEDKIRKRIEDLKERLQENADSYPSVEDPFFQKRLMMQSFNIESQLYALHYVLGEDYKYKYM